MNADAGNSPQIIVRYVILEKSGESWDRLHLTDIVTSAGEPVELAGKTTGHVWTFDAGDGVYALDSKLNFHVNGSQVSVNFSSGIESGKVQEMKTVTRNGKEYKIYQTVMTI